MATGYTNEDAEDFLDKVTELNEKVKGIIDGSIPIEKIDEELDIKDKVTQMREREAKEAEENKLKQGRKGKGHKGDYVKFCPF